jgi:DNA-binding transcriptional regulator YiaG
MQTAIGDDMTRYPHFAFPNLYLVNGYTETHTHRGVEMEFTREDELEQCIRHLVLRRPERLRGWDLRFLRRGLGITQAEFGTQVDRDEQTIARWEKSEDPIPSAVDVVIRMRFAARFAHELSIKDILSFVDCSAPRLPASLFLRFTSAGWEVEAEPKVQFTNHEVVGQITARVGPRIGPTFRVFDERLVHSEEAMVLDPRIEGAVIVSGVDTVRSALESMTKEAALARNPLFKVTIKGLPDDDGRASIH